MSEDETPKDEDVEAHGSHVPRPRVTGEPEEDEGNEEPDVEAHGSHVPRPR